MSDENAKEYAQGVAEGLREYLASGTADALEYCSDALDVRRTFDNSGELISVSLLVAFGGPTCWLDVDSNGVELRATWYSEPSTEYVNCPDFAEGILELFDNWQVSV